ncbi:MAG: endonuclease/exonuclease/phosphatase family protein [Candidatus Kaiserbacteria bacterium]|nr:endonuclease/exonuclease/phosphatase family protein [Candidatus Kaiserbacteria bacterium]
MRIISLNTWGGRGGKENLLAFFKKHADTTDIFCLQEIWAASYESLEGRLVGGVEISDDQIMIRGLQEISETLPNHVAFFRPHHGDHYGLLMMVSKNLTVSEEGEVFVYKHKGFVTEGDVGNHARNIQYVTIETETEPLTVINFHGLWNGRGKTDTEDRILQSKNILAFMKKIKGEYVLCGDFNLLPYTESIRLFEAEGLRNLIREHKVSSTRTSFYLKPEKYADYAFVTKRLKVLDFKVLPDEISDHAPLLIEVQ